MLLLLSGSTAPLHNDEGKESDRGNSDANRGANHERLVGLAGLLGVLSHGTIGIEATRCGTIKPTISEVVAVPIGVNR